MKTRIALVVLLLASAARAQTAPDSAGARYHFEAGVAQVTRGDLTAALREFEQAYQIRPHFSVLYNIGQAHAALGHSVEAVAAFERYLSEGGSQIDDA